MARRVCGFDELPKAVQLSIFKLLGLDSRLRCVEVSRSWRATLSLERSLWTRCELRTDKDHSEGNPRSCYQLEGLLWLALARAGGAFTALTLGPFELHIDRLLRLLHACAHSLTELTLLHDGEYHASDVARILSAAPKLKTLHLNLDWDPTFSPAMLRNDPPYRAVRVHRLRLESLPEDQGPRHEAVAALKSAVLAHQHECFTELTLHDELDISEVGDVGLLCAVALERGLIVHGMDRLGRGDGLCTYEAFDAFDAALLVRLLEAHALRLLVVNERLVTLLKLDDLWLRFVAAVQNCTSLRRVQFEANETARNDCDTACALLRALVAHPTVECISTWTDELCVTAPAPPTMLLPLPVARACGNILAAMVAADAPALHSLSLINFGLGPGGLLPFFRALPSNTKLRKLFLRWDSDTWQEECDFYWEQQTMDLVFRPPFVSAQLAEDVLAPAVRANQGLTLLELVPDWFEYESEDEEDDTGEEADSSVRFSKELVEALYAVERIVADRLDASLHTRRREWRVAYHKWSCRAGGDRTQHAGGE